MGLSYFRPARLSLQSRILRLTYYGYEPKPTPMPKERNDVRLRAAGPACERDCRGRSPHRLVPGLLAGTRGAASGGRPFRLLAHRCAASLRVAAGALGASHRRGDRQAARVAAATAVAPGRMGGGRTQGRMATCSRRPFE